MRIITDLNLLQKEVFRLKNNGKVIGLVPTMGYLHEGHLSLIRKARQDCKVVVVSIFINPLQFSPKEDLKKYPRDLNRDISLCKRYTDILFLPQAKAMYPDDYATCVEVGGLSDFLCGASRPGHFKGVATVVSKLFNIVMPDMAYFGQKDAQQAVIIKKMVKDLNMPVKVRVLPIVREHDGLAISSRNTYLGPKERRDAVVLFRSLILARDLLRNGTINCRKITAAMRKVFNKAKKAKIDYIKIVNPVTLRPLKTIKREALVLLAVFIGKTRLIDNLIIRRR